MDAALGNGFVDISGWDSVRKLGLHFLLLDLAIKTMLVIILNDCVYNGLSGVK